MEKSFNLLMIESIQTEMCNDEWFYMIADSNIMRINCKLFASLRIHVNGFLIKKVDIISEVNGTNYEECIKDCIENFINGKHLHGQNSVYSHNNTSAFKIERKIHSIFICLDEPFT